MSANTIGHWAAALTITQGFRSLASNLLPRSYPAKANQRTGVDPKTGREEVLFHPRQQYWEKHFVLSANHLHVVGRTRVG